MSRATRHSEHEAPGLCTAHCVRHLSLRIVVLLAGLVSDGVPAHAARHLVMLPACEPTTRGPSAAPFAQEWSRGRLGFAVDSTTIRWTHCSNMPVPMNHWYPSTSSGSLRDSVSGQLDPSARYIVQVVAAREPLDEEVVARVTMNHMGKRPHRELQGYWWPEYLNEWGYDPADTVMWPPRPPGWRPARDSTETEADEADTLSEASEPVRLYRWVTARRDSMIARIEVDPVAMGRPVWLPGARRWTADADETARYTVAAAFYWIREASLFHRIPRRPGREDTEKAWRYAEELQRPLGEIDR